MEFVQRRRGQVDPLAAPGRWPKAGKLNLAGLAGLTGLASLGDLGRNRPHCTYRMHAKVHPHKHEVAVAGEHSRLAIDPPSLTSLT